MRTWSLVLLGIAACGPIYPDQQAAPPPDPSQAPGPPGGAADPWSDPASPTPASAGQPGDPYGPAPDDPYAAPRGPSGSHAPGTSPGAGPSAPGPSGGPSGGPNAGPSAGPSGGPNAGPSAGPGSSPGAAPKPPSNLPAYAQALLDAHNRVRAKHCAPPLTWSPKLAQFAQQWANSLRDQGCKFGHSNGRYGENLAAGTSGTLDGQSVTDMWYDEIKLYSFASGGFSMQTGHFTQVVWRGTTQLGCAVSKCGGMDIWVCEYDPPGNVQGQFRQNVLPTGCRP